MAGPDLTDQLDRQIASRSEAAHTLFRSLCNVTDSLGLELFAVGGLIRDLLGEQHGLQSAKRSLDIDLALDGDVGALHDALASAAGARLRIHDRFGTASVTLPDGATIDVARTRAERYPSAGALPIVTPAPIEVDLARRDFSIHGAALALSGDRRGELLDPFGAVADIRARRICTLHAESFRDDPTRLVRAARYAARIGGTIVRRTLAEARRHGPHLQSISAERFGDAWRLLLREPDPSAALRFARRLRLAQLHEPNWTISPTVLAAADSPEMFWSAVGLTSSAGIERVLPRTVGMNSAERAALEAGAALCQHRRRLAQLRRPSHVAAMLREFSLPTLHAASRIWDGASGRAVDLFLVRRDAVRSPISARRLIEIGVPEGRAVGSWLRVIESAIWDGELDPTDQSAVARFEEQIRWQHDHAQS